MASRSPSTTTNYKLPIISEVIRGDTDRQNGDLISLTAFLRKVG
jgi:hypothetical protein